MKTRDKYLTEDVISIRPKLQKKHNQKVAALNNVDEICGNMIQALSFIIEEARTNKNIKEIKKMLSRVIKELSILERKL